MLYKWVLYYHNIYASIYATNQTDQLFKSFPGNALWNVYQEACNCSWYQQLKKKVLFLQCKSLALVLSQICICVLFMWRMQGGHLWLAHFTNINLEELRFNRSLLFDRMMTLAGLCGNDQSEHLWCLKWFYMYIYGLYD